MASSRDENQPTRNAKHHQSDLETARGNRLTDRDLTHGVGSIRNKSEVWSRLECVTAEEGRLECVTAEEGRLECVTAEEGDSSTEKYQTMILVPKEVRNNPRTQLELCLTGSRFGVVLAPHLNKLQWCNQEGRPPSNSSRANSRLEATSGKAPRSRGASTIKHFQSLPRDSRPHLAKLHDQEGRPPSNTSRAYLETRGNISQSSTIKKGIHHRTLAELNSRLEATSGKAPRSRGASIIEYLQSLTRDSRQHLAKLHDQEGRPPSNTCRALLETRGNI
ncbi:hypothetical protein RRG08_002791 [Elysia crispata]|uniref:Uncharacterized protein n=1 Tax=Elysia crispata TaxID=231223 RepID=A0AAE0XV04_9GAST|nr:hypothetical protein RRG08_002791 [Elysia crispata]